MFGHHDSAQATVLSTGDVSGAWEGVDHVKIEFVLEVHPPIGQAFRATATHHFIRFTHYPQVGDVVNVKYDPKSLKAELDLKDDIRYGEKRLQYQEQAERQAAQARRDALLSAPPGTPLPSAASVRGAGMVPLDPELQALMDLEEAERLAEQANEQQAMQRAQMPTGFPGMSSPPNSPAALGLTEAQGLHRQLEYTGVAGQAKILRHQQAGAPVQHFVPFFVEVLVQPDSRSFPFECAFTTWIDTSKGALTTGSIVPVKYDPQNTARMVFSFSA